MALPTQPNGSSIVPLGGISLAGSSPSLTATSQTQKTLNTTTGQTRGETVSVIINS